MMREILQFLCLCYNFAAHFGVRLCVRPEPCNFCVNHCSTIAPFIRTANQNLNLPEQTLAQFVQDILFPHLGNVLIVALRVKPSLNLYQLLGIIIANAISVERINKLIDSTPKRSPLSSTAEGRSSPQGIASRSYDTLSVVQKIFATVS